MRFLLVTLAILLALPFLIPLSDFLYGGAFVLKVGPNGRECVFVPNITTRIIFIFASILIGFWLVEFWAVLLILIKKSRG